MGRKKADPVIIPNPEAKRAASAAARADVPSGSSAGPSAHPSSDPPSGSSAGASPPPSRNEREMRIILRLVSIGELHPSVLDIIRNGRPPSHERRADAIAERERVLALRWEKSGKAGANPYVPAKPGRSFGKHTEVDRDELNESYDDYNKPSYRVDKSRILTHITRLEKDGYITLLLNGFGKNRAAILMKFSPLLLSRSLREDEEFRMAVSSANKSPIDDCELMHYDMAMTYQNSDVAETFVRERRGSIQMSFEMQIARMRGKLEELKVRNAIGDDGKKAEPQINFDEYFSNQQENEEYGKIYDKVIKGLELTDQEVKMFGVYQARFLSGKKAGKEAGKEAFKDEKIDL